MTDSPRPGDHPESEAPSASPYIRLPTPAVAAAMAVLLAALLAFGLYANANLRPQGVIVPTDVVSQAPPTATQHPVAVAATPTRPAVAAPATPMATPTPAAVAAASTVAPTPLVVPTLAGGTNTSSSPTRLPTVEPTLAAEVGQGYENFWHVRSQALLNLDPTRLPEVMDGDYLVGARQLIDDLRSQGRAIKTQVSLNYVVISATSEAASVVDDLVDNSFYVSSSTEEPITEATSNQLRVLYNLHFVSGEWKVVDSVRSE